MVLFCPRIVECWRLNRILLLGEFIVNRSYSHVCIVCVSLAQIQQRVELISIFSFPLLPTLLYYPIQTVPHKPLVVCKKASPDKLVRKSFVENQQKIPSCCRSCREIVLKKKMKTSQGILRFAWAISTECLNLLRILTHFMRNCSSRIQQTTASSSLSCVRGGEKGCPSRQWSTKAGELKFYFDYFSIQFQIVEAWQAT